MFGSNLEPKAEDTPQESQPVLPKMKGRVPITIRVRPEIGSALKRASLKRQLDGVEPGSMQDIVDVFAGVLFAVGEMELEAIKERQAAGIAAAKAKGVYKTNGDRRRGYRKAKDKVLKLHEKGHSPTAIARECGIARSTVYSYLEEAG